MSSHTEASYNKFTAQGKGTLVGNWAEERMLREFSGVGRTIMREHIPKKHLDFDNAPKQQKAMDNTGDRIYGVRNPQPMISESYGLGKAVNPVDNLAKFGKKTLMMEQQIMLEVGEEIKQKEKVEAAKREQRYFETSTGNTFLPQDYQQNVVGRRVMKTSDGKNCSMNERDEQLIVEHGTWRRLQKCTDDDLWMRIPKGDYTQQQPITLWTHMLERKNFQNSASIGQNPFARTSGFTQTADQVKSISGYYGNIDFEQESKRTDFRKTKGTDLNITNPYVVNEVKVNNLAELKNRVIEGCKVMSPANGLRALRIALIRLDHNKNGLCEPVEFKYGLRAFGIDISEDESALLLKNFDSSRSGKLSVSELIHIIRGESLNERRMGIVCAAYNSLDKSGNQCVTIDDLESGYDVSPNPEFVYQTKTGDQIMKEFLQAWDTNARDGIVSMAEFIDYYMDVSPCIVSDTVFENMVKNTWRI